MKRGTGVYRKTSDTGSDISQSGMEWEEPDTTGRKYIQIEVATGVRIWVWSSDGRTATPEDLRFTEEHDEWKRKYGVKEETDPTLEQLMMDNFKDHAERLRTGVNPETGEVLTEVERMQSWSVVLSGPSTLASLAYWGNRWGNVKVNSGIVDKKPTSPGSVNPKQESSRVHAVESKPKDNSAVSEKKGNHSSKSGVNDGGKGTVNGVPSYGKNSVPIGPYREVNGFPVKVKPGAQEKHIPNTPNYKQEIANGKNKSIFYGDNKTAQELLDKFAGKGQLLPNGKKERVDFGKPIGRYYDRDTGEYLETTKGLIHYGKEGAHIVPSRP
ncbi:polymorphic toxin type 50 domain-containing protein [Halalkalibacterium halodurans]|nr:polymorphic toxin type 50 domain-containing protein [Halalkalibacterium halodurans]